MQNRICVLEKLTMDNLRTFVVNYSQKRKKAIRIRGEVRTLLELIQANGYSVKKKTVAFLAARLLNIPRPKTKKDIDDACFLLAKELFTVTPEASKISFPIEKDIIPPWDESLPMSFKTQRVLSPKNKKRKALNAVRKADDKDFYNSWEWKTLRYEALKRYGTRCMVCGATPAEGARICVDHIKPRSRYPELQLNIDNLQILCNDCNMGKGNWDETDWRGDCHT